MSFAELAVLHIFCYNIASGFFLSHGKAVGGLSDPQAELKWISQPLDHFNKSENRTWKMKYIQKLDMWKPKGPIYVTIYEEAEGSSGCLGGSGMMYDLANETNGAMFLFEHRYYGDSQPFDVYTTANLSFLSSRQALADNARLLKQIKSDPQFASSKVVVVGGNYGGNLAAWMRLLYPNLVDAAISSSAPVLAKSECVEYYHTVGDVFKKYGSPDCFDKMVKLYKRLEDLLKTDDGIKEIKKEYFICEVTDMHKQINQQLFLYLATFQFGNIAQYLNIGDIKEKCDGLEMSFRSSLLKLIGRLAWNEKERCHNNDFDHMNSFINSTHSIKAWYYQSCTEFGLFQTSDNSSFITSVSVDLFYKTCKSIFGPDFDGKRVVEGVFKTNEMYGGQKPNVTKVVFVNGELDPWHRLSVIKDLSDETPAIVLPYAAHCKDMIPGTSQDPKEWIEARKSIKNLIKKWIGA